MWFTQCMWSALKFPKSVNEWRSERVQLIQNAFSLFRTRSFRTPNGTEKFFLERNAERNERRFFAEREVNATFRNGIKFEFLIFPSWILPVIRRTLCMNIALQSKSQNQLKIKKICTFLSKYERWTERTKYQNYERNGRASM